MASAYGLPEARAPFRSDVPPVQKLSGPTVPFGPPGRPNVTFVQNGTGANVAFEQDPARREM